MSIPKRQVETIANKILEEAYREGVILTVDQLMARVAEIIVDGSMVGKPITKFRPAPYRGRSVPQDWNDTVEELDTDITVLYEENSEQVERIINDFDYFETEKRRLERNLGELEDKIEELLLLNENADGYLYSVYDNFRNLNQIDTSQTTAWVDLKLGHVSLPHAKTGNVKIDLSQNEISGDPLVTDNVISITEMQPLANILDDTTNTAWVLRVVTDKEIEFKYSVRIVLDGSEVTRLVVNPHVTEKTHFTIRYTEDNLNWRELGNSFAQETMAYDFSRAWFKGLEIVLTKAKFDETESGPNGEQHYVYYVGITNISLLKIGFEDVAEFVSKELTIKDRQGNPVSIDQLSIEVKDDVPQGTEINYYIALQKSSGETLNWQPITPIDRDTGVFPKIVDLKSMSSTHPIDNLLAVNAVQYYDGDKETFNGLKFYHFETGTAIPQGTQIIYGSNTPSLYKGIKQFRIESFINDPSDHEQHIPGGADWIDLPVDPNTKQKGVITTRYADANNTIVFSSAESKYNYRITTSIFMENARKPLASVIRATSNLQDFKLNIHILVNGMPITTDHYLTPSKTITVNWPFTDGWNTITILAYKPDNSQTTLNLGIYPLSLSKIVRVDQEPMTYVPLFDYLYNVYEKDTEKYTVTPDNLILIGEYQKSQGARYSFSYNFTIDQGYSNIVRFKAELSRSSDPSLTPKLNYYKVRVT